MTPYWQSEDGRHVVYCGDCREVVPQLGAVDAVVTDPPYGIGGDRGRPNNRGGFYPLALRRIYADTWDTQPPKEFLLLLSAFPLAIIWGGQFVASFLPTGARWLVWHKENTMPTFGDAELAWTNLPQKSVKLFTFNGNGLMGKESKERFHPTQKPVALMAWCLGFLPQAACILDPFAGSGTTAVACARLGRQSISIELEQRYCDIIVRRLEDEIAQPFLIPPAPVKQQEALLI